jgi:hypothetical protein
VSPHEKLDSSVRTDWFDAKEFMEGLPVGESGASGARSASWYPSAKQATIYLKILPQAWNNSRNKQVTVYLKILPQDLEKQSKQTGHSIFEDFAPRPEKTVQPNS